MEIREWIEGGEWNPFNSDKILVHAPRLQGIVDQQYLPPIVVNLDIAGMCSYRCAHCHHRIKQIGEKNLPLLTDNLINTFPAFLKNWNVNGFRPLGCCIVGSKGDASIHPGLPNLLKKLHFVGVDVGLVSNGYAWSDQLIEHAAFYTKFTGFSIDAGTKESYHKIKNPPTEDAWKIVLNNMSRIVKTIERNKLRNDTGWKILILPQSYTEIYESCKIAKDIGVRYVQIRPADLSEEERIKIDIDVVNEQINKAQDELTELGKFEIAGIRHKFTNTFKKKLPGYCYLTPLTVTITSDGRVWACVDRRHDINTLLADCTTSWNALKDMWGSNLHIGVIHEVINRFGLGPDCNIRCSNFGYDKFFRNYFVDDKVDQNLI